MKYRPEIDGLRTLAVIPVILFHAGYETFGGGFVGVDVFFVISGYLITTIICTEVEQNRFSLTRFYQRRARRILPALLFVSLTSTLVAWRVLFPEELRDFGQSLVAVATFSSNILFWLESGYFATANEFKPLLHTWSLAVEEQYYLLFPLLFLASRRLRGATALSIAVAVFLLSLIAAHWGAYNAPRSTFYLLHSRAWELMIGVFCALYLHRHPGLRLPRGQQEVLSATGLGLIVFAILAFDKSTPFPSFYALVPTVGAGLVILFATRGTLAHRLLSQRPMVGIGLLSYSLYLWHQPVFAFLRNAQTFHSGEAIHLGWIAVVFLLSAFSYFVVETPFRRSRKFAASPFGFAVTGSLAMAAVLATGVFLHVSKGAMWRDGSGQISFQEHINFLKPNFGIARDCVEHKDISAILNNPRCQTGDTPAILLWGDSFSMHLFDMLQANPDLARKGIRQLSLSQCMPHLSVAVNDSHVTAQECIAFNQQVARHISETGYDFVIMASPFNRIGRAHYDAQGQGVAVETEADLEAMLASVAEFVAAQGATPVFVAPTPTNRANHGKCVADALWRGTDPTRCDFLLKDITPEQTAIFSVMDRLSQRYRVIDFRPMLCAAQTCVTHLQATPVYRDDGHFSVAGSKLVGELFDPFAPLVQGD